MKAEILFYKKFDYNVTSIVFKLSPYDPCVTKNITNVKKSTMVWHVDNLKVSHESNKIFTKLEKWLNKTYERLYEDGSGNMNISRGNIYENLGTNLDFSETGEIKTTMIPYIEETVKDLPSAMKI